MMFRYQGSLVFVYILSLLTIYVVSLSEQVIASPHLQVIQIAQANTPNQDAKALLPFFLKQLSDDLKTVPLSDNQKSKLDGDVESIDAIIIDSSNLSLKAEWNEIKEIIKPIKSISNKKNDKGIKALQAILISKTLLPDGSNDGGWGAQTQIALTGYLDSKNIKVNSLLKNPVAVASPTVPPTKTTTIPSSTDKEPAKTSSGGIFLLGIFGIILLIGLVSSLLMIYILREEIKKLRYSLSNTAQSIKAQNLQDITQKNSEIRKIRDELIERISNIEVKLIRKEIEPIKSIETKPFNNDPITSNAQNVLAQNQRKSQVFFEDRIVEIYNNDPTNLISYATRVSETVESMSNKRQVGCFITLREVDNGNYWILSFLNESTRWLVPIVDLEIDKYILKTVESLFVCLGKPNDSFNLVKPAVVKVTDKGEWQLEEKGAIEFIE